MKGRKVVHSMEQCHVLSAVIQLATASNVLVPKALHVAWFHSKCKMPCCAAECCRSCLTVALTTLRSSLADCSRRPVLSGNLRRDELDDETMATFLAKEVSHLSKYMVHHFSLNLR